MQARIAPFAFYSPILETETEFLIVQPVPVPHPLPAVLLLRANPHEWLAPWQDEHRGGRNLITVMQELVARGYCPPLAFVLPRTCNFAETAFVGGGQALYPELIKAPAGLGTARIDAFLDQEVIPLALASGLIADRLAIDGFSLGGAAAVYHALRRPERFVSVGSYDGSFLVWEFDNPLIDAETPSDLRLDDFAYLYGFPPHETAFRQSNVLDRLQRPFRLPPALIHYAAAEHPTANGWRVREALKHLPNHASEPRLHPDSAHNWYWTDEHLYRSLPFHGHYLYGSG